MSTRLSRAINTHRFPSAFFRFPGLLRGYHALVAATTLRVWYVRRALKAILKTTPPGATVLDAGCGAGDLLLPMARTYPDLSFTGVDKVPDNVAVCETYARHRALPNTRFLQADLDTFTLGHAFDVISCITVLQYVADDDEVLRTLHKSLTEGGLLLLYVPVCYERVFSWYLPLMKRYFSEDYDAVQEAQKQYTPEIVLEKLRATGFSIETVTYAYGTPGKRAYELYNASLQLLQRMPWYAAALLVPLFALLLYPPILLLMCLDYTRPHPHGNGLLVQAHK